VGKEGDWVDKNVDLKKLAERIQQFFYDDGFSEVKIDEDPHNAWFQIQARKTGVMRSLVSSRKSILVVIKGNPNKFEISLGTGEWGKNVAAAALIPVVGWAGLVGLGLNAAFTNKLWNFIKSSVESLSNSYHKPVLPTESNEDESLQILKRRLASGEISKEEFDELKATLE